MTTELKTVSDYQLIDHGIDGCQYFPGCCTYGTGYSHVVTGCGDSPAEAIEDALEQIAMGHDHVDVDALEAQILADEGWREFPTSPSVAERYPLEQECEECGGNDTEPPCEACGGSGMVETDNSDELYYYVSIRYNLGE